jgi:hypothetical protein
VPKIAKSIIHLWQSRRLCYAWEVLVASRMQDERPARELRELARSSWQQPERRSRRLEKVDSGAEPTATWGKAEVDGNDRTVMSEPASIGPAGVVAMACRNAGLNATPGGRSCRFAIGINSRELTSPR